jgi:hypothetical protein
LHIIRERHLRRVLIEYITFYNDARPHPGLEQQTPIPDERHRKVLFSAATSWEAC